LHDGIKAAPKILDAHARTGQHLMVDELVQVTGNLQAMHLGAWGGVLAHGSFSLDESKGEILDQRHHCKYQCES
jgi:hypothetical protein